jgi:hypothetical protein
MDFIRWNMQKPRATGESNFWGGNGSQTLRRGVFVILLAFLPVEFLILYEPAAG